MFMIVPIFNSMMRIDRSLIEAASDSGASAWQTLWNVIIPLSRTGIIIGSIFVITIVMGDFVTIGVMGGQQIASIGKIIAQVTAGMDPALPFQAIEDRAAAILSAVKHAGKLDVILLAGKGHEPYQEIKGRKMAFSDFEHATLALSARLTMMRTN